MSIKREIKGYKQITSAIELNNYQYRVEGNDVDDFVNVKVGSVFLESDKRLIAKIKAIPNPYFKFCYEVTMASSLPAY